MAFKQTKQVIVPVFPLKENEPAVMKITGKIYVGEKVEKDKDPAHLCTAVHMPTGDQCLLIVNAALESELERAYPDGGYVGRVFEITKLPKRDGKKYNGFRLNEGEWTDENPTTETAGTSAPAGSGATNAAQSGTPAASGKPKK